MIALALDGPYNGYYISDLTAKLGGYELIEWPTGEEVWVETSNRFTEPQEFSEAILDNETGTLVFE